MSGTSLDQRFAEAMGQLLGPEFPTDIALAVSGGGDSMAMLTLAHNWAHAWGVRLWVVTVDHGLRPESAAEAAMVAAESAALGHPHATLRWHWDGTGNLMDAARRGRLEMIDRWRGTLRHVLMAHTRDDLAETFVMRLARGSGVEGLSAMASRRIVRRDGLRGLTEAEFEGALPPQWETVMGGPGRLASFEIVRPCLGMTRAELRHYLRTLKGRWVEDPTNEDPEYDRVRMRQALPMLETLGLDVGTLAATAERMARAREALRARAAQVWGEIGSEGNVRGLPTGEILFDRDGFETVERDTQLRLVAAAVQFVSGAEYRPRGAPLDGLVERLLAGGGGTISGCELRAETVAIRVFREWKAVAQAVTPVGARLPSGGWALWDGRWRVQIPDLDGHEIRALGEEGWLQTPKPQPAGGPPYHSARSLPAVWRGHTLLACPHLGVGSHRGLVELWPMGRHRRSFEAFLLSH